ncbi:MAG: hypothetical protein LBG57_12730 [Treponema sp.]|jgi:hypothetical protein|nr:hypothetical protein [Treponema sp.]
MNSIRAFRASAGVFLVLLFLISCGTLPEVPGADEMTEESEYIPLEGGALVYVLADVQKARPILELVQIPEMNEKQAKQMIDKTRYAAAALYPPESGRRFHLTAWGAYPGFRAAMAFSMSRNWKKQRSAAALPYWYSAKDRLSVALNAKQAFVSAPLNDVPLEPFFSSPGVEAPEGFGEFRRGAIVSCWFEHPAAMAGAALEKMQIPLQLPAERIFVSLFPAAGRIEAEGGKTAGETESPQYEALIRIQVASAAQARALAALLTLARAFLPAGIPEADGPASVAALLFARAPVQNGANLDIRTAALTQEDIALLFSFFSVYSD